MKISIKNINFSFSNWFIAVLPLLLAVGCLEEYCMAMVSIALHELGHVIAALLKDCRLKAVKVSPIGLKAVIDEINCNRHDLIVIYICGPAVNLFIAVLSFILCLFMFEDIQEIKNIFILNICLAVFNLLPAMPLDGGKILFETLSGYFGIREAGKFTKKAAIFLSAVFILAGMWQLFMGDWNFNLLVIGIFILVSLSDNRMEAAFMNIRQIIFRRSRLMKKGIYPARDLVAMKWMHLGECLKCMDYDRIHIVHVLEDDMTVMAVFTENEIIEAMLSNTSDLSFEELVNILRSKDDINIKVDS